MILNRRSRKWVSMVRAKRPDYKPSSLDISEPAMIYARKLMRILDGRMNPEETREHIWNIIFHSTQECEHPTRYKAGDNGFRPGNSR